MLRLYHLIDILKTRVHLEKKRKKRKDMREEDEEKERYKRERGGKQEQGEKRTRERKRRERECVKPCCVYGRKRMFCCLNFVTKSFGE